MWVWTDDEKDVDRDFVNVENATALTIMSKIDYVNNANVSAQSGIGDKYLFFVKVGPGSGDIRWLATIPGGERQAKQVEDLQREVHSLLAKEAAVLDIREVLSEGHGKARQLQVY